MVYSGPGGAVRTRAAVVRERSGMIQTPTLVRFRTLVCDFRSKTAALAAVERELNDRRPVLVSINAEIERVTRDARSPWPAVADAAQKRLAELRAQLAAAQAEIDRLTSERDRLQRRRDDSGAVVSSCRDFLMERGVPRSALEA